MQAADAESEDSDGDMNWEDMDLDAVKLPGAKKEELAAPEPPKRPAKDDEVSNVPALTHSSGTCERTLAVFKVWGGVNEHCYPCVG